MLLFGDVGVEVYLGEILLAVLVVGGLVLGFWFLWLLRRRWASK